MKGRAMRSAYLEWAKLASGARFNLATSGMPNVLLQDSPLQGADLEITIPESGYGYGPLLERIARHAGAPRECVVTASGTSMANHLAMAAVLKPGDEALLEAPAYGPLVEVAHYLGAEVRRFPRRPENCFAVDLKDVERALTPRTRLVVLTNLHNPSSDLIPCETLRALAEIARERDLRILVDEVYLEFVPQTERPCAFPLVPAEDNPFIVTSSLTKGYGLSGLRCGWILATPQLARRIWRLNDLFGSVAPHAAERLSVQAFDHLRVFAERAAARLAENRPLLRDFLDAHPELDCAWPEHGATVFPRLRGGKTEELIRLLREKYDTSVVPGSFFEMPEHFRLGITAAADEVREGLARLGAALQELEEAP